MKRAYVICCNDSIEYVILSSMESAIKKKNQLSEEFYQRNKGSFHSRKDYDYQLYWHIKTPLCEK